MSNEQQMYGTSGTASGDDSPSAIGDSEHHVYWSRLVTNGRANGFLTAVDRLAVLSKARSDSACDWTLATSCCLTECIFNVCW